MSVAPGDVPPGRRSVHQNPYTIIGINRRKASAYCRAIGYLCTDAVAPDWVISIRARRFLLLKQSSSLCLLRCWSGCGPIIIRSIGHELSNFAENSSTYLMVRPLAFLESTGMQPGFVGALSC